MKIMVVGDLHFGVRNNSQAYLDFQTNWFLKELIPNIEKHKCDKVVFLGDVFDSRNSLSPVIVNRVRELFKILTKVTDVHCIVGNHDIYYRNNKNIHSLTILEDQGVTVYENPTEITFGDKKALMLPWIVKDEQEDVMKMLVNNEYDLCFGHLEINNFEMVPGVFEDKGFKHDLFSNCENVYSGHFHLRRKHDNIQYTGTPYELTWSDYMDVKGVYIYDTDTSKEEFVETKGTPQHIKLSFDEHREVEKEEVDNNILRVKFLKNCSEVDKINIIERINSLNPIACVVDDESDSDFDSDEDIEASIKDTMGFLNEFLNIIEIPEDLDKKVLREMLNEMYEDCA
jgi:DNA repair exonuclease SbcCD nuclease subunit